MRVAQFHLRSSAVASSPALCQVGRMAVLLWWKRELGSFTTPLQPRDNYHDKKGEDALLLGKRCYQR